MLVLWGISYSPWTERARWALDHAGIEYRFKTFAPVLHEPALRWRRRQHPGPATVPLLLRDGGDVVESDSITIARWADRQGGAPLFPAVHDAAITRWVDIAECGLSAARVLLAEVMSQREDALLEQAPRGLPRPMAMAMAQVGLAYFRRKYALNGHADAARARFTEVLEQVSEALEQRATLLDGGLTFADVAIATMLHGVRPADATLAPHIRMGKATRDSWTQLDLAERFRHLLTWRDALYAARPQAPRR